MPHITKLTGDSREILKQLPNESVQMCLTSPPYWNLRDYQMPGQLGLEDTVNLYINALMDILDEVWRILRKDGTLWLNLGDSYASAGEKMRPRSPVRLNHRREMMTDDFKVKELLGIPWRTAFALQAAGWYLRSEIIWAKGMSFCPEYSGSVMPEPAYDRPVKAHEQLFLLTKSPRYYYDYVAVREESIWKGKFNDPRWNETRRETNKKKHPTNNNAQGNGFSEWQPEDGRNLRDVWAISSASHNTTHFATFPEALVTPCILAGSAAQACEVCGAPFKRQLKPKEKRTYVVDQMIGIPGENPTRGRRKGVLGFSDDQTIGWQKTCDCAGVNGLAQSVVLDPFAGSGTVSLVALRHGRDAIGIELNPDYMEIINDRTGEVQMTFTGE